MMPWNFPYVATPAALPVAILLSAPAGIRYGNRLFMWKVGTLIRITIGAVMLLAMGSLTAGDLALVAAASAVSAAAPVTVRGWRSNFSDTGLYFMAGLILVPVLYAHMPYAVPALSAVCVAALVAAGLAAPRTERVAEMSPGFDWRNTPNEKRPGGELCGCPRHRNRRENPGVLQLCADCMETYLKRPACVHLTRRIRLTLWFFRNAVVHFMEMGLAADVDDCRFCGSRRGGLRGRVMPPPDA